MSEKFTQFAVVGQFSYEVYGVGTTADDARQWAAVYGGCTLSKNGGVRYATDELAVLPCTEAVAQEYHRTAKNMGFYPDMHHIIGILFKRVNGGLCLQEELETPNDNATNP